MGRSVLSLRLDGRDDYYSAPGFEKLTVHDCDAAVERATALQPDVITIVSPRSSELLGLVRLLQQAAPRSGIVALGDDEMSEEERQRVIEAGAIVVYAGPLWRQRAVELDGEEGTAAAVRLIEAVARAAEDRFRPH